MSASCATSARLGVNATGSMDEICALDADVVVYSPVLASTAGRHPAARIGQERGDAVGWIYPGDTPASPRCRPRASRGVSRCTAPASTRVVSPSGSRSCCRRCAATFRHVRAEEFSDIRNYPTEMVVRE
jgi:hypothetical protein